MRNADCDSPAAITCLRFNPPSGSMPVGCRSAAAACENMSYEKLSPGWLKLPYRAGLTTLSPRLTPIIELPPSTPSCWADTPTHAAPSRISSTCAAIQSGPVSTPPLTFSHSTTTMPLKREAFVGVRTSNRVLYAAVLAGVTDHWPSVVSGTAGIYALAVPAMKYSASEYPTSARLNVVEAMNGVPGPVMGPSMVGSLVAPAITARMAIASDRAPIRRRYRRIVAVCPFAMTPPFDSVARRPHSHRDHSMPPALLPASRCDLWRPVWRGDRWCACMDRQAHRI